MMRRLRDALGLRKFKVVDRKKYRIVRPEVLQTTKADRQAASDLAFLRAIPSDRRSACIDWLSQSHAQLRQDLFALAMLDFRRNGFFVEFGATNGILRSNTLLMERQFGWTGILAEPSRAWQSRLKANRDARIDTRCVWSRSGETLTFNETENGEHSTLDAFSASDRHAATRETGQRYDVETVSLVDLLVKHDAPQVIDYLSIDTEGSEYDILSAFDFARYRFRTITCEHNFTPARARIHDLLIANGYRRVLEDVSKFDDWYVLNA